MEARSIVLERTASYFGALVKAGRSRFTHCSLGSPYPVAPANAPTGAQPPFAPTAGALRRGLPGRCQFGAAPELPLGADSQPNPTPPKYVISLSWLQWHYPAFISGQMNSESDTLNLGPAHVETNSKPHSEFSEARLCPKVVMRAGENYVFGLPEQAQPCPALGTFSFFCGIVFSSYQFANRFSAHQRELQRAQSNGVLMHRCRPVNTGQSWLTMHQPLSFLFR